MLKKLSDIIHKYWNIVIYLLLGILTTIINYAVYFPLYNHFHLSATISNCVAWVAAVSLAFLTNKPFVFKSNDWSYKTVMGELSRFLGCRIGSGLIESAIIFLTVDLLDLNGNLIKILTSVFVVLSNYFASKFFVFRKKD